MRNFLFRKTKLILHCFLLYVMCWQVPGLSNQACSLAEKKLPTITDGAAWWNLSSFSSIYLIPSHHSLLNMKCRQEALQEKWKARKMTHVELCSDLNHVKLSGNHSIYYVGIFQQGNVVVYLRVINENEIAANWYNFMSLWISCHLNHSCDNNI